MAEFGGNASKTYTERSVGAPSEEARIEINENKNLKWKADDNSAGRAEVSFETKRSRTCRCRVSRGAVKNNKGENAISLSDTFNDHHDAKILIADVPLFDVL